MKFKSDYYGLNKKIKIAGANDFLFNEIPKLTIKTDSIL